MDEPILCLRTVGQLSNKNKSKHTKGNSLKTNSIDLDPYLIILKKLSWHCLNRLPCELCHNIYLLWVLFVVKELSCKTLTSSLRIDGKTYKKKCWAYILWNYLAWLMGYFSDFEGILDIFVRFRVNLVIVGVTRLTWWLWWWQEIFL